MTRFTFKGDITWGRSSGGRSFEVAAQNQAGLDDFALKAGDAVKSAVQHLEATLSALSRARLGDELQFLANHYFLTGKTLNRVDAGWIKILLNQTLLGLTGGKLTLKIAATAAQDDPKTGGYVNFSTRPATKLYHNQVFDLAKRRVETQGAIHITGARLNQGILGVKVLIHEASHKYAGTEDYVYFEDEGQTVRGELKSKERALRNADGLAWFAIMVGREGGEARSRMYG